uniref:Uncharacterized protein n=1 Tax=Spongospora subterranea TaxID=70186 RepID=A0A0H5RFF1_9EUKA|eukprot:CRZ07325.1 hypothetical protein [Spongospora subterranea]
MRPLIFFDGRDEMKQIVDRLAVEDRSKPAQQIWTESNRLISASYPNNQVQIMTKSAVINRVQFTRTGGRSADNFRSIEEPELSLTTDRLNSFLGFSSPFLEKTTLHRVCGWGHPALYKLIRRREVWSLG